MKKIIWLPMSLMLTILMCSLVWANMSSVSNVSATDIAYAVEGGNIYFDKGSGKITGCDESVTSANIPSEINGAKVTAIGDFSFYALPNLTSVIMPNSITSIGEYAFSGRTPIKSIIIPSSVTSIGMGAFGSFGGTDDNLDGSASIIFETPSSVTSIGAGAFSGANLKSITIPGSVISLDMDAFNGCSALVNVEFEEPSHLTSIERGTFLNCWSLTSIKIPESVTSIDRDAFANCYSLAFVEIPSSVTSMGDCKKLFVDVFGNSWKATFICPADSFAFKQLDGRPRIEPGYEYYKTDDGVIYSNDLTEIIACPQVKGEFVIPDGVEVIAYAAFKGCKITNITIPSSVTHIYASAFENCWGLTNVTIPSSVTFIGPSAFSGCKNLTSITIPSSVTDIWSWAFEDCDNLTIYCPAGSFAESYAKAEGIRYTTSGYVEKAAGQKITVMLNGNALAFDEPPYIENNTTRVPMRKIFETLGANVEYDAETKTVTAVKDDTVIKLVTGALTAEINGEKITLAAPVENKNGTTMVPLRFVSEALGAEVNWDGNSKTITIN